MVKSVCVCVWIYTWSSLVCLHGIDSERFTFMCYLIMSVSQNFCHYPCIYSHVAFTSFILFIYPVFNGFYYLV